MKERNGSVLGVSRFGPYVLDEAERVLLKDGQPVKLTARMFDVLAILVRNAGKLVTKDDLLRLAWPGVIVEESNIHVQISALRAILGRDAITTVARMGYRLEMSLDAEEETRRGAIVGSNVPHPVSPIVGRQRELAEIAALLGQSRLVTLKGIGGIGKTRLAVHTGLAWTQSTPDRVWFVNLAPLTEAGGLAGAVIRSIGGSSKNPKTALDDLTVMVRENRTLLILDNCEHLIDDVAVLCNHLLQNCPELLILCTSRQSLMLTAETLFPVEPLVEPDAVDLFMARAKAAAPLAHFSADDMSMITALVQRLEGISLAIELAAARVRTVSLRDMNAMLGERFQLLSGGSRIAQPRQQTLFAAIEWSFQLLPDEERVLFSRISIFEDSFTLEDVAGVLGTSKADRWHLLERMTSLSDKSLIQCRSVNGEQRFELFDSVREFGRTKLQGSGELEDFRRKHAGYYLAICKAAREIHETPQWTDELRRLRLFYPNIRAALKWALEEGRDIQGGAEIVVGIFYFWIDESMLDEGLDFVLAAGRYLDEFPPTIKGQILHAHGGLYQDLGNLTESEKCLERSVAILKSQECPQGEYAIALNELAVTRHYLAKYDDADALYQQALLIYRRLGRRQREGQSLLNLGVLYIALNRLPEAEETLGLAHKVSEESGNQRAQSVCLMWLAVIAYARGDAEECLDLNFRAKELRVGFGSDLIAATIHHRIAKCAAVLGRDELAKRALVEALQALSMLHNPRAWAEFLESSIPVALALEHQSAAAQLIGFANAWRTSNNIARTALWEREFEEHREKTGQCFERDAFQEEMANGARMSLSDAVQVVRSLVSFDSTVGISGGGASLHQPIK